MKTTGILFVFSLLLMPLFSFATSGPSHVLPEPAATPQILTHPQVEPKEAPEPEAKSAKNSRRSPTKKLPPRAQIWLT